MASQSSADVSGFLLDSVQKGFKDGDDYHRYRPTYTDEVTNRVIQMLELHSILGETKTVLELAAGTGKFTQKFLPKLTRDVCLIASEPVPDFLETLKQNCPSNTVLQFAAEQIPLDSASVHGIVAAQSFHWFYDKQALDEIYRVMVPGCSLVLLWNYNDRKKDWINQVKSLIDAELNDPHQYHTMFWKKAIDDYTGFKLDKHEIIQGDVLEGDVEFMLKHCSTHTGVKKFGESRKREKLEDIRQVLLTHPDTKGRNTIQLPFFTDVYSYKKV